MPNDAAPPVTDLAFPHHRRTARPIERRQLSPVALTAASSTASLPSIRSSTLICWSPPTRLLDQARIAEAEIMAGNYRGPMHGIPFALKDIYCTAGIRTTSHSRTRADYVPASMRPPSSNCGTRVPSCSASSPPTNSRMAVRRSICPGHRPAIHGAASISPADRPAAPAQVLRRL